MSPAASSTACANSKACRRCRWLNSPGAHWSTTSPSPTPCAANTSAIPRLIWVRCARSAVSTALPMCRPALPAMCNTWHKMP